MSWLVHLVSLILRHFSVLSFRHFFSWPSMAYCAQVNLPPRAIDLRLLSFSSVLNLTFLSRNGGTQVAKITISEYNHNTSRRPFDILIARAVSSPFCPVLPFFNIANCGDLLLALFFVMLIKVQF